MHGSFHKITAFQATSEPADEFVRNGACLFCKLLCVNNAIALTAYQGGHITDIHLRDICYIQHQLVHADSANLRDIIPVYNSPHFGAEAAGETIGIADCNRGYLRGALRAKNSAIADGLSLSDFPYGCNMGLMRIKIDSKRYCIMSKTQKPNRPIGVSVAIKIVADLLLGGLLLVIFAAVHHGGAWILAKIDPERFGGETIPAGSAVSYTPPEQGKPLTASVPVEAVPEEIIVEEDNRTEWQKKFADRFTDEVVITENSYTSPNISITIETKTHGEGAFTTVYYVADVYVAGMDCFRTYIANETFGVNERETMRDMSINSGSVLATSGDFYSYNAGVMVRNGVWYREKPKSSDICVLYGDGTMKTYLKYSYDIEELKQQDVWQIWNFGPLLLTDEQEVPSKFNSSGNIQAANPRSAIGYYEPGHYCFLVADGRDYMVSCGLTMSELAQTFKDLGCTQAYNLDGGGSAVMSFRGELYSKMSSPKRELADILLIAEPVAAAPEADRTGEIPADLGDEEGGSEQ